MADERVDLDEIRVLLNLEHLGELIGYVALKFAEIRGIEPPDFEGQEMRDLSVAGWERVCHMSDRAIFTQSVQADLARLGEPTTEPQHRPEFGGAAPLGWDPPV